ncbi:hypothetical protein AB0F81_44065 [Actinoplanes sp. NPDC024001]|uniref:hypothetical protein n=1 Tax=Actinoplanes sp. NPDC024001 TaxID=3154598 RepID=UPI0033E631DA
MAAFLLAALFALGAAFTLTHGSPAGAVLVAVDGALVTAYAIGRLRAKAADRAG